MMMMMIMMALTKITVRMRARVMVELVDLVLVEQLVGQLGQLVEKARAKALLLPLRSEKEVAGTILPADQGRRKLSIEGLADI